MWSNRQRAASVHTGDDYEWQEIMAIDADIEPVVWAIKHLRDVFCTVHGRTPSDVTRAVDTKLQGVVSALQTMLRKHPTLYTLELVSALKDLQFKAKNSVDCDNEDGNVQPSDSNILSSIDQLSAACFTSVSDFTSGAGYPLLEKSKSFENLVTDSDSAISSYPGTKPCDAVSRDVPELLDSQKLEHSFNIMVEVPNNVDEAFDRAFGWIDYSEQICLFAEKKLELVGEFAEDLLRHANAVVSSPAYMWFQPFELMHSSQLEQEIKYAEFYLAVCKKLHLSQSLEAVRTRQIEHRKICRSLKADWERQLRQIGTSNIHISPEVHRPDQGKFLSDIRQVIRDSEMVLRAATSSYFKLMNAAPSAASTQSLYKTSDSFQFDAGYSDISVCLSSPSEDKPMFEQVTVHSWLPTNGGDVAQSKTAHLQDDLQLLASGTQSCYEMGDSKFIDSADLTPDTSLEGGHSTNQKHLILTGELLHPLVAEMEHRRLTGVVSDMGMVVAREDRQLTNFDRKSDTLQSSCFDVFLGITLSRSAQTHKFRKMIRLAKCRHCESYIYRNGVQCDRCGLSCHKKCLENLRMECGGGHFRFLAGPEGSLHPSSTPGASPSIPRYLARCIMEIDERGLDVKGIYRVSAVKSTVESLCQHFQEDDDKVDLSVHTPHVVAGILKRFLHQLPEPLLTYDIYDDLMQLVKNEKSASPESTVQNLTKIISRLPLTNYVACAQLIRHLKRVADNSEQNHMTASNLARVFGPTLFRSKIKDQTTYAQNFALEMANWTRVIELLIINAQTIFGSAAIRDNFDGDETGNLPDEEVEAEKGEISDHDKQGLHLDISAASGMNKAVESSDQSSDDLSAMKPGNSSITDAIQDYKMTSPDCSELTAFNIKSPPLLNVPQRRSPLSRQPAMLHRRRLANKSISLPEGRPLDTTTARASHSAGSVGDYTSDDSTDDELDMLVKSPPELGNVSEDDEAMLIFHPGRLLGSSDSGEQGAVHDLSQLVISGESRDGDPSSESVVEEPVEVGRGLDENCHFGSATGPLDSLVDDGKLDNSVA